MINFTEFTTGNTSLILGAIIFSIGAYLLYRYQLLTFYGSILTGILGFYLTTLDGLKWIVPVLYFFFTSVIFTRLNNSINKKDKKPGPRNIWQVLANILPAIVVSVFYLVTKQKIYILCYIALIAAVTADTWASEIGPVFNKQCLSVKNFRKAKAGTSGGISISGSLAALAASFSVTVLSCYLFYAQPDFKIILILSASAFLATFTDTFLGAYWEPKLIQSKYFKTSGESMTPNDLVNFLGSVSAPVFFLLLCYLF